MLHQKGRTILNFNEAKDDSHWHQVNHMKEMICSLLQTGNHASGSSLNFYRLDGFHDVNQWSQSTKDINFSFKCHGCGCCLSNCCCLFTAFGRV